MGQRGEDRSPNLVSSDSSHQEHGSRVRAECRLAAGAYCPSWPHPPGRPPAVGKGVWARQSPGSLQTEKLRPEEILVVAACMWNSERKESLHNPVNTYISLGRIDRPRQEPTRDTGFPCTQAPLAKPSCYFYMWRNGKKGPKVPSQRLHSCTVGEAGSNRSVRGFTTGFLLVVCSFVRHFHHQVW